MEAIAEEAAKKAHIEWLKYADTGKAHGVEMTIIGYGFLSQAVKKAVAESITRAIEAREREIAEKVKELGHQQEDDTIWCNMDEVLALLAPKEEK